MSELAAFVDRGILATLGHQLDREYIERWIAELGLMDAWARAQST